MPVSTPELHFRPRLRVLDDHQVREIHSATLEVLERTGVRISHPRALEILLGAGARVEGERVRIPSWLVEEAIRKAPSRIVLGNRRGERAVFLEGDKSWFGPSLDCLEYLEPATGRRMRFTTDHCRITASLSDYLPNFTWSMVIGAADNQPPEIVDRIIARQALTFSEKPLVFCCNSAAAEKDIYEMAVSILGSRERFQEAPLIVHYSEVISPLTYYDPAVDKILFSAENGIPLINISAPQFGGTAPASFAGTIIQGSAESLSGLVLAQACRAGAPFIYGAQATIMDMKSSVFSYGAPEMTLMISALSQMAQFYGLPFFGTAGATDAKLNDPQAGIEASFQCLAAAAVGSCLVHDCSSWMDHGSLVSPAYMILVNEILHMVNQFMQGIEVSRETLTVELIDKIGPGGNYLQEEHTLENFRKIWYSDLFDRSTYARWMEAGARSFEERLREKTLEAMKHQPPPLEQALVRELDRMQAGWR